MALLVAAACGGGGGPGPDASGAPCPRITAPAGVAAALLPTTTCELPAFDAPRFQALLGQLRGVPVVINVWGSWCGPCLREAPELSRVAREFRGRAQFLGVDINDLRAPAQKFILRFKWPYPSVFDQRGSIRDALGLVGQPNTVVLDRTGKQTLAWPGPITAGRLRRELTRLLTAS